MKKVGGEDKRGESLLKIITLAFLRCVLCKKLGLEIWVKVTHLSVLAERVAVCQMCCGNCHCVCVLLGYRKPKVKCVSMNLQEKGLS